MSALASSIENILWLPIVGAQIPAVRAPSYMALGRPALPPLSPSRSVVRAQTFQNCQGRLRVTVVSGEHVEGGKRRRNSHSCS